MTNPSNNTLVQTFLSLMEHLNLDEKQAIIQYLSESVQASEQKEEKFLSLYGSFQSSSSADELIDEIRDARISGRAFMGL